MVIEGVFDTDAAGGVCFHEARGIGPATIAEIQAQVRHRLLSVLARRGVLEREDAEAMVRRAGLDQRLGRERMLFDAHTAIARYQEQKADGAAALPVAG